MTTITALPTPPTRSDPTNFSARADAFMAALPQFVTDTNTVASEVNATATAAANSATQAASSVVQANSAVAQASNYATAAANSAAAAGVASGASIWVSGTTYSAGDCRWSPITFATYRRKTAGSGTTDPSLDPTNWAILSSPAVLPAIIISANFTAVAGNHYVLTTTCVGTFPATADINDTIMITDTTGLAACTLNPNGLKFNGDSSVMTLNSTGFLQKQFIYSGATKGWI